MAQAAFEFSLQPGPAADGCAAQPAGVAAPDAPAGFDRTGFDIGWDHAHHRLTPPLRHLHGDNPVRQGWERGRTAFGARTLRATAAVRQWLALRLEAWQHGQAFEGVQVTPHFLARIDSVDCPVSRQTLTLCADRDSDATVTRLNPDAAYAAGNLVVLSRRVAAGLAAGDWAAALDRATGTAGADSEGAPAGLSADEWTRLAVLASFATPLPHARAALLPLRVLPPNRVRVINPVQALQVMLTLQFSRAGYARRLLALAALMPGGEIRQAFQIFMHTLLARRLAVGPAAGDAEMRRAMEDSWADVLVNRRWQRLASRLTAADCERLLQRASQRGLVVGGGRWLSSETAIEGWALPAGGAAVAPGRNGGYAGPTGLTGRPAQAVAVAASAAARPGSTRSLGSQKLAS